MDVNGVRICENGGAGRDRSEVDMTPREVHIDIDLNTGSDAEATVWTDDLTHEYVHINARTTKADKQPSGLFVAAGSDSVAGRRRKEKNCLQN